MNNKHILLIGQLKRFMHQHDQDFDAGELTKGYLRAAQVLARCAAIRDRKIHQLVISLTADYLPLLVGRTEEAPVAPPSTPDHSDLYVARLLEKGQDALARSLQQIVGPLGDDIARGARKCGTLQEFTAYCEKAVALIAVTVGAYKAQQVKVAIDDVVFQLA